tara:strand:- start:21 stop:581 length:561 start_codon:yes stop_codon:yes gene_type:complete
MTTIVIVNKTGILSELCVKNLKREDLYKKCNYRKSDEFDLRAKWEVKVSGSKYNIELYGKIDGKAGMENKYDFPPPVDELLFFGNMALVNNEDDKIVDLTIEDWNKIYEKLFGGFEDLADTALADEEEEDELKNVPKEKKTKNGYLKDGFVVDDNSDDHDEDYDDDEDSVMDSDSELEEEEYLYSD